MPQHWHWISNHTTVTTQWMSWQLISQQMPRPEYDPHPQSHASDSLRDMTRLPACLFRLCGQTRESWPVTCPLDRTIAQLGQCEGHVFPPFFFLGAMVLQIVIQEQPPFSQFAGVCTRHGKYSTWRHYRVDPREQVPLKERQKRRRKEKRMTHP